MKEAVLQPAGSGVEGHVPPLRGEQSEQFVVWMRGVLDDVASLFKAALPGYVVGGWGAGHR